MNIQLFGHKELARYADHAELDEASAAVVAQATANPAPKWWTQDITASRSDYASMIGPLGLPLTNEADMARVDVRTGAGNLLPLHIYRPRIGDRAPTCTVLFLRGSGMCMGSMALYDSILQRLSVQSGALVVAPDYRLAPEHPYPAGHDDAYEAFLWLRRNAAAIGGDATRLVVAGDSAGGMLVAATALRAGAELPGSINLMVLVAPAHGTCPDSPSVVRYWRGYLLDGPDLAWLYKTYAGEGVLTEDADIYPIHAENLSTLPPTLMITAGADIMRDDAEAFARRIHADGIAVELHRFEGTIHPFLNMGGVIPASGQAIDLVATTLKRGFRPKM